VIHPVPSGTRDVLPDETRELRAITDALRSVFEARGYGEIYTPALEYESVLETAEMAEASPAYRLFDETGTVLALRSDMTVPIARVASTRYSHAEPPLRFCYFAHCYRGVTPQRGQLRELLQAGVELIGAPAPGGTAEVLTLICDALDAVGLEGYRIGVGDAALYPRVMEELGVDSDLRRSAVRSLAMRDIVGLERELQGGGADAAAVEALLNLAQLRGGDALERIPPAAREASGGLKDLIALLEQRVRERVIIDLGLVRNIGYYTGAVFEIYDPAVGTPIGGGGRYDDLLGRFGRSLPAVGFALGVDRLHAALAGEERGTGLALAQNRPQ
jgi:ATP phosphoribosyltransferase regulatory subunit